MQIVDAIFQDGAFYPKAPVELPEGSDVSLQIVEVPSASTRSSDSSVASIETQIAQLASQINTAEWQSLPKDLNSQLDAHLYETPLE